MCGFGDFGMFRLPAFTRGYHAAPGTGCGANTERCHRQNRAIRGPRQRRGRCAASPYRCLGGVRGSWTSRMPSGVVRIWKWMRGAALVDGPLRRNHAYAERQLRADLQNSAVGPSISLDPYCCYDIRRSGKIRGSGSAVAVRGAAPIVEAEPPARLSAGEESGAMTIGAAWENSAGSTNQRRIRGGREATANAMDVGAASTSASFFWPGIGRFDSGVARSPKSFARPLTGSSARHPSI